MKKMNWGVGITIFIIVFLVFSIGQVIFIHYKVDYDLVVEEYYEEDLKYQSQLDKIKRANALEEPLKISLTKENVQFSFPKMFDVNSISGTITFYKPSDDLQDIDLPINITNDNQLQFETNSLTKGLWRIKVNWNAEEIDYYNEKIIMVQ